MLDDSDISDAESAYISEPSDHSAIDPVPDDQDADDPHVVPESDPASVCGRGR